MRRYATVRVRVIRASVRVKVKVRVTKRAFVHVGGVGFRLWSGSGLIRVNVSVRVSG